MPQVTVYVREDDIDLWKAIEKKSEWLSNHLNKAKPEAPKKAQKKDFSDIGVCPKHGMPVDTRGKCMAC